VTRAVNDVPTTPGPADDSATVQAPVTAPWWTTAVGYQVYIRSFADSDGNGIGDLPGINGHLGYLELLGVQAVWITPFYPSPMADAGYDVADPRGVDPSFGTLSDLDALVASAHTRGLKVVIDVVPNHTSDQRDWFVAALAAGRGSPERDRYLFRDGKGSDGSRPPNNWTSVFGGPAWSRVDDGQWYLHLFAPEQPDLNWDNADVWADLERTLRFWLDRGFDGFRIDVAHGMAKPEGLPDAPEGTLAASGQPTLPRTDMAEGTATAADGSAAADSVAAGESGGVVPSAPAADPRFDNDGVHDIHRMIRRVIDEYPGATTLGEVWVSDPERFARYLRPDELHQAFDFSLVESPFDATRFQQAIDSAAVAATSVGSNPVWTLSNHDVPRPVTRYGGGAVGTDRARASLLVELALPGAAYLYNGEELGLPSVEVPDDKLQDPTWERSGHTQRGRDASRLPMPWEGDEPPYGFTEGMSTWLPAPAEYATLTVERQLDDPGSTLNLVRTAIELRQRNPAFSGTEISWYGAPSGCFAFRRDGGGLVCALNAGDTPIALPPGSVLLTSAPLVNGELPANAAAWLIP
jgi:alpha-glucosidase